MNEIQWCLRVKQIKNWWKLHYNTIYRAYVLHKISILKVQIAIVRQRTVIYFS